MSSPLKTTVTGSMESTSVEEMCTKPPCDDAKQTNERLQPTADPENCQALDTTHTGQPSRQDTDMDPTDDALESGSPSDTHEPEEAVMDNPDDTSGTGKRQIDNCVSPLWLKRKCVSVDESKLRQHFLENDAWREKKHREEEAARQAIARTTGPNYFDKGWMFTETLGEGSFAQVRLAYNDRTEEYMAVKIINTREASSTALRDIQKEVNIHQKLNHKNVLSFWGVEKYQDMQYLFLQYAPGGDLYSKIVPNVGMPQENAQRYYRQLIDGLEYLHRLGVAHRDIKPENLLLDERDNLKIADFGFAIVFRRAGTSHLLNRVCGSPPYLAPEVASLKVYHAEPADIWATGIVLVALLSGDLPWDWALSNCAPYVNWRESGIERTPWNMIDLLALCLLRMILQENPNKRFTIEQIRNSPWFKKDFSTSG